MLAAILIPTFVDLSGVVKWRHLKITEKVDEVNALSVKHIHLSSNVGLIPKHIPLLTSVLQLSHIGHSIPTIPRSIFVIRNLQRSPTHRRKATLSKVVTVSGSCYMAARGQNTSQVAGIFQHAPPVGSSVVPGQSAPLQFGRPGSVPWDNATYALDSRQQKPSTWDEVNLLQEALKPSIRSFARVTSRSPPFIPGSPWLSYASQLDILQRQSNRCWSVDQRPGAPPRLARLGAWSGGILMIGDAEFLITEEMTEEFIHAKLRGYRHRDGSP